MDIKQALNSGILTTIATVCVMAGYNQMADKLLTGIGLMILGGGIYTAIVILNKKGYPVSGRN